MIKKLFSSFFLLLLSSVSYAEVCSNYLQFSAVSTLKDAKIVPGGVQPTTVTYLSETPSIYNLYSNLRSGAQLLVATITTDALSPPDTGTGNIYCKVKVSVAQQNPTDPTSLKYCYSATNHHLTCSIRYDSTNQMIIIQAQK